MAQQRSSTAPLFIDSPRRMSEQEFLEWSRNSDVRAEWVDGEAFELMPPDDRHQDISGFLLILLRLFANRFRLGTVRDAPFEMRLPGVRSYREPDLLFVATEHADRLDGKRLVGPADLVVEIVGEDSARRDLHEKFEEYAAAGVTEYWIVDPRPSKDIFKAYSLTNSSTYEELRPNELGRVRSRALPGFWIDSRWLEANPLPDALDVLAEIAPAAFGGIRSSNE